MRLNLFLPLLASCTLLAGLAAAQSITGAGSDVAVALEQKRILDTKVRAALDAPEREMRATCGRTGQDARAWSYRFAEQSYAALAASLGTKKQGNPFVNALAEAYYGRSRIYHEAQHRPMRKRELHGRLKGNDQRIKGIMRAARGAMGPLPDKRAVSQAAQAKIAALTARHQPAAACR